MDLPHLLRTLRHCPHLGERSVLRDAAHPDGAPGPAPGFDGGCGLGVDGGLTALVVMCVLMQLLSFEATQPTAHPHHATQCFEMAHPE